MNFNIYFFFSFRRVSRNLCDLVLRTLNKLIQLKKLDVISHAVFFFFCGSEIYGPPVVRFVRSKHVTQRKQERYPPLFNYPSLIKTSALPKYLTAPKRATYLHTSPHQNGNPTFTPHRTKMSTLPTHLTAPKRTPYIHTSLHKNGHPTYTPHRTKTNTLPTHLTTPKRRPYLHTYIATYTLPSYLPYPTAPICLLYYT